MHPAYQERVAIDRHVIVGLVQIPASYAFKITTTTQGSER
jgi:hypothetical protein